MFNINEVSTAVYLIPIIYAVGFMVGCGLLASGLSNIGDSIKKGLNLR